MIRSEQLIDKLVADLHFHNYLTVQEGDLFSNGDNLYNSQIYDVLKHLGINTQTDLYHSGTMLKYKTMSNIYEYIDDVFIDYFFRTYNFKEIIFPKGFCSFQVTPHGVVTPTTDIVLNLQNIYDRCTFANNIWRLFCIDDYILENAGVNKSLFNCLFYDEKTYGKHGYCGVLETQFPFCKELDAYLDEFYGGTDNLIHSNCRTTEILRYCEFSKGEYYKSFYDNLNDLFRLSLNEQKEGYIAIKDSHIFGDYSIEDLLLIYVLITEKYVLKEDSFLILLLFLIQDIERTIIMDFRKFELENRDYHFLDSSIINKDLFLRFTSLNHSKAFTFTPINEAFEIIQLFDEPSIRSIMIGNTLPLPYLYNRLNLI